MKNWAIQIHRHDVRCEKDPIVLLCPQCCDIIPESKAVLELVMEQQLEFNNSHDKRFPVIVIEGLDATGEK